MRLYDWDELDEIIFELKNGKAAIVETDTVMGIIALEKTIIYKIKKRSIWKKLILLIDNKNYFETEFQHNPRFKTLIDSYWPGKLTIVYKKLAYRFPNYGPLITLISRIGAVYSSSANISGSMPVTDYLQAAEVFQKHSHELIIVKNQRRFNVTAQPSTIFDYDTNKVIREGAIPTTEIHKIMMI